MGKPITPGENRPLYEADFFRWTQEQGRLLRAGVARGLDWDKLAEEVESSGRSERREIWSRLAVLLLHLLKWQFQSDARSNGWRRTLLEQRRRLHAALGDNPSLEGYPLEVLEEEYGPARLKATGETGLPLEALPQTCPYTVEQILEESFLPDRGDRRPPPE
jgi:hypothetical protein